MSQITIISKGIAETSEVRGPDGTRMDNVSKVVITMEAGKLVTAEVTFERPRLVVQAEMLEAPPAPPPPPPGRLVRDTDTGESFFEALKFWKRRV